MDRYKNIDVDEMRQVAIEKAKEVGCDPYSEGYYRALVEEATAITAFGVKLRESRPLLYERLDDALGRSSDLVLVEVDYLDYICHAFAIEGDERRFALVLPPARIYENYLQEGETRADIRGVSCCSCAEWNAYIDDFASYAKILEKCFNEDSDRFIGLIGDKTQLESTLEGQSISLIRLSSLRLEANAPFDPLSAIRRDDTLLEHVWSRAERCISAIVWESSEVNDGGFDLGYIRESYMPFEYYGDLDTGHMRETIEFPESYECQLFVWDNCYSGYAGGVNMVKLDTAGCERSVKVFGAELEQNLNYSVSFYLARQGSGYGVALKELVRKIGRGTSLKGKDLSICGDVRDERGVQDGPTSFVFLRFGATKGYYSAYESYYVDNASIVPDGLGSIVIAKRVREIPSGQERYTLLPEDGTVLFMPRNGKGVACYRAKGPTLVSNNLFIIWPDTKKIDPEYLAIALNSRIVSSQFDQNKIALSKFDLENAIIPMAEKDEMSAVISRNREIRTKIDDLNKLLGELCNEDPLNLIWSAKTNF